MAGSASIGMLGELRVRLIALMFLRVLVVSVLLGATLAQGLKEGTELSELQRYFITLIICTYAATIVYALLMRLWPNLAAQAAVQLVLDFLLITSICVLTGNIDSIFTILYAFIVLPAALIFYRKGVAGAAALGMACVIFLAVNQHGNLITPEAIEVPQHEFKRTLYLTFVNIFILFVVAGLSWILSIQAVRRGRELEISRADLRNLKELYGAIVRSIPCGVVTIDGDGVVVFANDAMGAISGRRIRDIEGRGLEASIPSALKAAPDGSEIAYRAPGGEGKVLSVQAADLHDESGRIGGRLLVIQDMTSYKALETAVRNSERLASLGKVAASLAHEIRNPLAAIANSVELMEKTGTRNGDSAKLMRIVSGESDRLNALIERFLQYARPAAPRIEKTDLGALVSDTLKVFKIDAEAAGGMTVVEKLDGDAWALVDPAHMKQVLWNLLRNASQAMEGKGRIEVSVRGMAEGETVELEVVDNGPGVSREELSRMFDPFYTTKEGGFGLGLSISHSLVVSNGGSIEARNNGEGGMTFTVRLPGAGKTHGEG